MPSECPRSAFDCPLNGLGGFQWPQEKGVDIFRMKGVLAMEGCAERYVYQGVHMLFTGETLSPWGDAPRINRLVFIGKNLDRKALEEGFASCMVNVYQPAK